MFDATKIFPVVEVTTLPGPRFDADPATGRTKAEDLVVEPIRDARNAGHGARAAARQMVSKLLRTALRDALSRYFGTRTKLDGADALPDPTPAEAGAVTTRLAQEPMLAELFRKVARLRGVLLFLDNLDRRDGLKPKAPPAGNAYPGVGLGGLAPAGGTPLVGIR